MNDSRKALMHRQDTKDINNHNEATTEATIIEAEVQGFTHNRQESDNSREEETTSARV